MTYANISTSDICEYFQNGDITALPDEHIKIIVHKLFSRLQRGLSDEETKQKRIDCIKNYINNHELMASRYLKIIKKQQSHAKKTQLNNSNEKYKEQYRQQMKIIMREIYKKTLEI
jgi:hypothetical protein